MSKSPMSTTPRSERVYQRLKDQFAPTYLTLASIIQGVALAFLAQRIEATAPQLDAADWLLASATFILYLVVWQEYVMQVLAYVWVPTLLDAAIPFAFLACELFLAHFIYQDLRAWLLTLGLTCVVGAVASLGTWVQAGAFGEENREVASAVEVQGRYRTALVVATILLCLGLWALYDILRLDHARLAVAAGVLVVIGLFVAGTVPYWNRVLAYARGE